MIKHVTFFHTNDIAFLHTDNDQRENTMEKKDSSFNNNSNQRYIRYFLENYEIWLTGTEEDLMKWREIPSSSMERRHIIKMSYHKDVISTQIHVSNPCKSNQKIGQKLMKFMWKNQDLNTAKTSCRMRGDEEVEWREGRLFPGNKTHNIIAC